MEILIRMYHTEGYSQPNMLIVLQNHYDTKIYGLGSVDRF